MRKIDLELWDRRDIYQLFSKVDYPFYSVTIPIKVTDVKRMSKKYNLSFYYLMIWACTKAMNTVEAFKMQIKEDEVWVADTLYPSFTYMKQGEETFIIINAQGDEDCRAFCENVGQVVEKQTTLFGESQVEGCPIDISCTPWFDFTALTNEHNLDKNDTIPRIAWGKYYEENGELMVHLSIEVNHRTIDGFHIGKFKTALDSVIESLV